MIKVSIPQPLKRSLKFFLAALGAAILTFMVSPPVGAQLQGLPNVPSFPLSNPQVEQNGNLQAAWVQLDGQQLLQLGSTYNLAGGEWSVDVAERVLQVESQLYSVLERLLMETEGPEPSLENLVVVPSVLNEEQVIIAVLEPRLSQTIILTVTDGDVALNNRQDLGEHWSDVIKTALIRAYEERQPSRQRTYLLQGGQIAIAIVVISGILALVQKQLKQQQQAIADKIAQSETYRQQDSLPAHKKDKHLLSFRYEFPTFRSIHRKIIQEISLKSRLNLNTFLRLICLVVQIFTLVFGLGWLLRVFPDSRGLGIWLVEKPLPVLLLVLLVLLLNKGSDVLIDYYLQVWSESLLVDDSESQRRSLRIPTFAVVLKSITSFFFTSVGCIWVLSELGVPVAPVLAGAGIIGFAISFASQSLIQDVINGCLILWEDQYAVGDVIVVEGIGGLVESMNLRMTQLRNLDGELISIPNSSIRVVKNLSNGWARVNFAIEVDYHQDTAQVMAIMEEVALELFHDPQWQALILDPPEVLGVDHLSHRGLLIRLLIKTKPLQQWPVGREFRRRLQIAFQKHHITLAMPHQILHPGTPSDKGWFHFTATPEEPT